MAKDDDNRVLGERHWLYIMWYLAQINTAYLWRKYVLRKDV